MENIIVKAKEYSDKAWSDIEEFNEDHVTFENIVTNAFVAGAMAKSFELLRWRDPKVELPNMSKEDWVLIKIQHSDGFIGLPQIGELRSDGYWHSVCYDNLKLGESFEEIHNCKVIGWRPIL